ncbi:MAG: hypothetical protein J7K81_01795 [Methanophagales archaeon]|nr:hypothetical protein [Methanophagales archaeon]
MNKRNQDNQIEGYIKRKAEEEFKKLMDEKKGVDNFTVLLFGISRLFYRLEETQDTVEKGFTRIEEGMEKGFTRIEEGMEKGFTKMEGGFTKMEGGFTKMEEGFARMEKAIRNSMYPIWLSIVAGIVVYIIINVFNI